MRVLVNMKKMGSRRNAIVKLPYELQGQPSTVKELIEQMVLVCVQDYNTRIESKELLKNLSLAELEDQAVTGKISFGVIYGENKAKETQAVENALQCFEDGIYRIFCGTEEYKTLEQKIRLSEECELTFIRLTMLTGRLW
ncbi:MAG: hypothetical protein IJF07_02565 [Lachnospiraceae bacterium]|nr:hypothetical protein [Lachnospiraceae bacterium]